MKPFHEKNSPCATDAVRIGTYQGPLTEGDVDRNIDTVQSVWAAEAHRKLHFLCFPECYLTGYSPQAITECAMRRDDPRLTSLIEHTRGSDTVLLVGLSECRDDGIYNGQAVIQNGALLGISYKTMLTDFDKLYFKTHLDLPVYRAHGVSFGVAICHTTSYPEPALYLRLKGARLLFTPHFNCIAPQGDGIHYAEHRTLVLNNQAGLAALLKMVVVRSNVIIIGPDGLGSGDSNIWNMNGSLVAAGEPFAEQVVHAAFDPAIFNTPHFIDRGEVPLALYDMLAQAAHAAGDARR